MIIDGFRLWCNHIWWWSDTIEFPRLASLFSLCFNSRAKRNCTFKFNIVSLKLCWISWIKKLHVIERALMWMIQQRWYDDIAHVNVVFYLCLSNHIIWWWVWWRWSEREGRRRQDVWISNCVSAGDVIKQSNIKLRDWNYIKRLNKLPNTSHSHLHLIIIVSSAFES